MATKTRKRMLTESEEFDIMKLVLDKFLWIGAFFMGYGLFLSITNTLTEGAWFIVTGAIIMLVFAFVVIREFEMLR